ncbi:MAG: SUMF1/EgtB/PvdO family nonheme iron enzyme [Planctomycetes bacterium]|nr:SUMF1/EgtB/PvdO family nonheme iron enzyme [Planctomycetota bacterium]
MRKLILVVAVLLTVVNVAAAVTIQGIDIDFVTIGNAGNAGDTRSEANPSGAGAVGYSYSIGKYEITNAPWDTFTTAAGAPTGNPDLAYDAAATWVGDNIPTNGVNWYEATQFCNYLTTGDKSQGAYLFSGDNTNPGDFLGIDRGSAVTAYGTVYVIPTEDEWYAAAYYTPAGYSTYANSLETVPSADSGWNYSSGAYSSP